MSNKITIKVPYLPPSVNSYWRRNQNGGVRVSEKGKEFKKNVSDYVFYECKIPRTPVFMSENLKVNLVLNFKDNRKCDIDNYCKGIFDSLNGILWTDDKQITLLTIEKNIGTKKPNNFILEVSQREKNDNI